MLTVDPPIPSDKESPSPPREPTFVVYKGKGGLIPGVNPRSNRSMNDAADEADICESAETGLSRHLCQAHGENPRKEFDSELATAMDALGGNSMFTREHVRNATIIWPDVDLIDAQDNEKPAFD
jgi:hypothetical protein